MRGGLPRCSFLLSSRVDKFQRRFNLAQTEWQNQGYCVLLNLRHGAATGWPHRCRDWHGYAGCSRAPGKSTSGWFFLNCSCPEDHGRANMLCMKDNRFALLLAVVALLSAPAV